LVAVSGYCREVRAQNSDRFYLSGDAALQGGAITANVRGGGGIWYNPASLADLPGLRLDVDMTAYALSTGAQPDLDAISPDAEVTRLTTLDLRGVPAAMSVTHNVGPFGIGFGLFVPTQTSSYLRTRIVDPEAFAGKPVDFGVDITSTETEYFGGPSIGTRLSSTVSIGLSLLAHYRSELQIAAIDLTGGGSSAPDFGYLSHTVRDWIQVGFQPVIGVQLQPKPTWKIGITLRFPSFRIYQVLQTIELVSQQSPGENLHRSDFSDNTGFATSIVKPPRIHVGISKDFGETRLAVEGSYQAPFRNLEVEQDLRPLWNFRVGGRHRFSDTFALGGGLFTNLSANRAATEFGEKQIDFYGVTLAGHLGSPYEVQSRGGKPLWPLGKLLFGTTIGLTYAFGAGTIVRGKIGIDPSNGDLFRPVPQNVFAHEIMLSLGSSIEE